MADRSKRAAVSTALSLTAGLLIGGELIGQSSGGSYEHIYAATGRTNVTVPLAGARFSELCIAAGQEARRVCILSTDAGGSEMLIRHPEIVSGDDKPLQSAASRRPFRNWKNSAPSRSRRFIISGDRTISPTMAAIFGARK